MFAVKLLYALFGIVSGLALLKYRKVVYSWTGKFYWAEKYLGSGGTVFIICLVWLGLIFVSVGYPFGAYDHMSSRNNTTDTSVQTSEPQAGESTQPTE